MFDDAADQDAATCDDVNVDADDEMMTLMKMTMVLTIMLRRWCS